MQIRLRLVDNDGKNPRVMDLNFPFEKISHLWIEEDIKDPEKKRYLKEYELVETGKKKNLLFNEGLL